MQKLRLSRSQGKNTNLAMMQVIMDYLNVINISMALSDIVVPINS